MEVAMTRQLGLWAIAILTLSSAVVHADSLWERRNPYSAYLFQDYRARRVGDLLTIIVNENTESEALEKREMDKKTQTSANYAFSGKTASDNASRSFSAAFDGEGKSQRKFDGKN